VSGLLLVISSSIAHNVYYRTLAPVGVLAGDGRIMVGFAIEIAEYFGINPPGFVAQVVAFAFGLAAASFFLVIILGVFDKYSNREGAIAGILVGLIFTAGYIIGVKLYGMNTWFFGVSPEGIGTLGMVLNFVVTCLAPDASIPSRNTGDGRDLADPWRRTASTCRSGRRRVRLKSVLSFPGRVRERTPRVGYAIIVLDRKTKL